MTVLLSFTDRDSNFLFPAATHKSVSIVFKSHQQHIIIIAISYCHSLSGTLVVVFTSSSSSTSTISTVLMLTTDGDGFTLLHLHLLLMRGSSSCCSRWQMADGADGLFEKAGGALGEAGEVTR